MLRGPIAGLSRMTERRAQELENALYHVLGLPGVSDAIRQSQVSAQLPSADITQTTDIPSAPCSDVHHTDRLRLYRGTPAATSSDLLVFRRQCNQYGSVPSNKDPTATARVLAEPEVSQRTLPVPAARPEVLLNELHRGATQDPTTRSGQPMTTGGSMTELDVFADTVTSLPAPGVSQANNGGWIPYTSVEPGTNNVPDLPWSAFPQPAEVMQPSIAAPTPRGKQKCHASIFWCQLSIPR